MQTLIRAKQQAFKAWKPGKDTRVVYDSAKYIARQAVHYAHHKTEKVVYENIDPKLSDIFHINN